MQADNDGRNIKYLLRFRKWVVYGRVKFKTNWRQIKDEFKEEDRLLYFAWWKQKFVDDIESLNIENTRFIT